MADRADLKELTLKKLKELAKKHVGAGHAKLKTKAELLGALKKVPKALAVAIKPKGSKVAKAAKGSRAKAPSRAAKAKPASQGPKTRAKPKAPAAKKILRAARPPATKAAAARAAERDPRDPAEETPTVGGRQRAPKRGSKAHAAVERLPSGTRVRQPQAPEAKARRHGPAQVVRFEPRAKRNGFATRAAVAEPLVEGFFVARVAGTQEVRTHHLVEESFPPSFQPLEDPERLGELPWGYGSDAEVALARDPRTLFYLWDFSSDTIQTAAEALRAPRAVLVLFEEGRVVRELDFALESRSYYLHDLVPGHSYRVEAYFVGADGQRRRIGRGSNVVTLPPEGPSRDTTVRFMRVPWGQPLNRRGDASAMPLERRYLIWERVPLPNSGGFVDRVREWVERDEGWSQAPSLRSYLGSSFMGLGSSEQLGASERWAYRSATGSDVRGDRT